MFKLLCLFFLTALVASEWCCRDPKSKIKSALKAVTRSRVILTYQTEYHKMTAGYKLCNNNTIGEDEIPKVDIDVSSGDNEENRQKLRKFGNTIWQLIQNGRLSNGDYHSYCPVYSTKSRVVKAYQTEYYKAAVFDGKTCPDEDRVCCEGYKAVGTTCVDESKADSAGDAYDFLAGLGVIG